MFYRLLVFLLGVIVFSTCNSSKSLSNARFNINPALDCFNADCSEWIQDWSVYNQADIKLQLVQDGDPEKRFLQSVKDAYSIRIRASA